MYKIEQDEKLANVWYILDPEGDVIYRHIGDKEDIESLLSHLNK